jgi:hypothetical protein
MRHQAVEERLRHEKTVADPSDIAGPRRIRSGLKLIVLPRLRLPATGPCLERSLMSEANKKTAKVFYELAFNQNRPREAVDSDQASSAEAFGRQTRNLFSARVTAKSRSSAKPVSTKMPANTLLTSNAPSACRMR